MEFSFSAVLELFRMSEVGQGYMALAEQEYQHRKVDFLLDYWAMKAYMKDEPGTIVQMDDPLEEYHDGNTEEEI